MCWAKTTKIMGIRGPVARVPKTVTYKTYQHFSMGGLGPPASSVPTPLYPLGDAIYSLQRQIFMR